MCPPMLPVAAVTRTHGMSGSLQDRLLPLEKVTKRDRAEWSRHSPAEVRHFGQ
jgi:hypothetical protein